MKLSKETLSDSKKRKGWRTGERKEGRNERKECKCWINGLAAKNTDCSSRGLGF